MRNFDWILPIDGPFFSRMFAWRNAALVNRTRRLGSNTLLPFLEIVEEPGGSVSCNTQLNCRTLFTAATALLLSSFFGFLFGCSSTFQWEITSRSRLKELTFRRMPILTRRFGASTFQEVFTRRSIGFLRLASASGISFSRHTSTSCFWRLWLRGRFGFRRRFRTIVTLMPETALVSLRTLAFFFPVVTNTFSSFNTTQSPVTLDHCSCVDFLMSGVKISQSKFLIYTSSHHCLQPLIIERRNVLMNLHVVQFQHGFWVDEIYFFICTDFPEHNRVEFLSSTTNFRPILYQILEQCR